MISFEIDEFSTIRLNKIISLASEKAAFLKTLDQECLKAMNHYLCREI